MQSDLIPTLATARKRAQSTDAPKATRSKKMPKAKP